jgi:hypothetical protein
MHRRRSCRAQRSEVRAWDSVERIGARAIDHEENDHLASSKKGKSKRIEVGALPFG